MNRRSWILIFLFLVFAGALVFLGSRPAAKSRQKIASGLQAAELGAQLAFMQNMYRERNGTFTADFSKLEEETQEPLSCRPQGDSFSCYGYTYTLESGHWLVAESEQDSNVYIAFDLLQGGVDCSHASHELKRTVFCSSLE